MPSIKCWMSSRLQITTPWRGSSSTSSGRDPRLFDSDHKVCSLLLHWDGLAHCLLSYLLCVYSVKQWGDHLQQCVILLQGVQRRGSQPHVSKLTGHSVCTVYPPLPGQRRPTAQHERRCQDNHVRPPWNLMNAIWGLNWVGGGCPLFTWTLKEEIFTFSFIRLIQFILYSTNPQQRLPQEALYCNLKP